MKNFADRLCDAVLQKNSRAVVGLDPRPELLPSSFGCNAASCAEFCKGVIDASGPYVCAVKPQIAFFEALGLPGFRAYMETIHYARARGLLVIADVKRGDIGSTVEAYAAGHLEPRSDMEADAITVNAYLGADGIKPFTDVCAEHGKGLFVLLRTSNPSAGEVQDVGEGDNVWRRLAGLIGEWGSGLTGEHGYSSVGAVVGATYPDEALEIRKLAPRALFLMPGVGVQGGKPSDTAGCFDDRGLGAVVPSSRGIIFAFRDSEGREADDWQQAVADAAEKMRNELNAALGKGC